MHKNLIFIISFILLIQTVLPQSVVNKIKPDNVKIENEILPELKEKAFEFLRETAIEVNNLKTPENRIGLSAEIANLMWFEDENEGRKMFQIVINDFRRLLARYDSQINELRIAPEEQVYSMTGKKRKIRDKFTSVLEVRKKIAESLVQHDPKLAWEFFTESAEMISNPAFRKYMKEDSSYFETRLIDKTAKQDIEIALKYAREILVKELDFRVIEILGNMYENDEEKGIAFGKEIVDKIRSLDKPFDGYYIYSNLLGVGEKSIEKVKNKKDSHPIFSKESMREIADALAQSLMKAENGEVVKGYVPEIENYAPERAAQLRSKFKLKKIPEKIAIPANAPTPDNSVEKQFEEIFKKRELTDKEKQLIIEQHRQLIAGADERSLKISMVDSNVIIFAQFGYKDLAREILNEVDSLIPQQLITHRDYKDTWTLVAVYSYVDTERSFSMLEKIIPPLNDTIAAMVKFTEFIDDRGIAMTDGELMIGSVGNVTPIPNLARSKEVVLNLSKADLGRLWALTNRFDRQEYRILAKMLILRSILQKI